LSKEKEGEIMFPGLGKMNPKQMQGMLKQFGIKTEEINAKRVIIETEEKKIVIEPANVSAMTMQGQKTYTVMGTEREESAEKTIPIEDIKMVAEQAGCSEVQAKKALEETNGDIAEAILKLKK
jgi:nascent polypeptide-associated complex subunit alpha